MSDGREPLSDARAREKRTSKRKRTSVLNPAPATEAPEGALVGAELNEGQAELQTACEKGNFAVAMHLIRKGCKADQVDEWGWTAFGRAASKGHAEICRYLMASGVDANLASTHGVTALHEASREGHINTIYYLREMGADPYHKNLAGKTPLDLATTPSTQEALVADLMQPKHKFRVGERVLAWQMNIMHIAKVDKVIPTKQAGSGSTRGTAAAAAAAGDAAAGDADDVSFEYLLRFDKVKSRLNSTVKEENLLEMNEEHMLLKEGLESAVDTSKRDRKSGSGIDTKDVGNGGRGGGKVGEKIEGPKKMATSKKSKSSGRKSPAKPTRALSARGGNKKRKVNYAEISRNNHADYEDEEDADEEEEVEEEDGPLPSSGTTTRRGTTGAGAGTAIAHVNDTAADGGGDGAETEGGGGQNGDKDTSEAGPSLPLASSEFALPHSLRVLLEQDMINISQKRQLHTLPKSPSVHQILLKFKEAHTKASDGRTHADLLDPVTLEPITIPALNLVGLRELFNQALGQCLLYRFERPQFARIKKLGAELAPCDVYGAEHLMRLTDKLPELISASGASKDAILQIGTLLNKLMTFLDEEKYALITGTYVDSDDAYGNQLS